MRALALILVAAVASGCAVTLGEGGCAGAHFGKHASYRIGGESVEEDDLYQRLIDDPRAFDEAAAWEASWSRAETWTWAGFALAFAASAGGTGIILASEGRPGGVIAGGALALGTALAWPIVNFILRDVAVGHLRRAIGRFNADADDECRYTSRR